MPPTAKKGRFSPFNVLLWGLFVLIGLYLLAWPPLEGLWAKNSWKQVPCYVPKGSQQYFFEFNSKTYGSQRVTLWTVIRAAPFPATPGAALMAHDTCYVRPNARGDAGIVVLMPLAPPTQEQLMSRVAVLAMVLAAVVIMTWRVRKMAKAHTAAGAAQHS